MKFLIFLILINISLQNITVLEHPENLDFSEPIPYTVADFGKIPYGSKTISPLKFANPPDGCTPFKKPTVHEKHLSESMNLEPPIYLVERGNCKFTQKVENAQYAGAKMVIIMDNVKENAIVTMADDGRGDGVFIPAIFVNEEQGLRLRKALIEQERQDEYKEILLQVDFLLRSPSSGNLSKVKFYLDIPKRLNYHLILSFFNYYFLLNEEIDFQPVYFIFDMNKFFYTDSEITQSCLSGTNYCTIDQDGQEFPGNGEELVEEYLFQLCVFEEYGLKAWKDYITLQFESCYQIPNFKHCQTQIIYELDISYKKLKKCMKFDKEGKNDLLEQQVELFQEYPFDILPGVEINERVYKGSVDGYDVLEAVCASNVERSIECQNLIDKFLDFFEEYPKDQYNKFLQDEEIIDKHKNNN